MKSPPIMALTIICAFADKLSVDGCRHYPSKAPE